MMVVMFASNHALASPELEFTILVATVALLILRTWSGVNHGLLTRRVSWTLTVAILVLMAIFVYLVYVRFQTLV